MLISGWRDSKTFKWFFLLICIKEKFFSTMNMYFLCSEKAFSPSSPRERLLLGVQARMG